MPIEDCAACNGTGKREISILQQLVGASGKGQGELGRILGLSPSAFSRLLSRGASWWRSANNSTYHRIPDLAKELGVTKHQLTGEEPIKAPKPPRPRREPPAPSLARSAAAKKAIAAKNRKPRK